MHSLFFTRSLYYGEGAINQLQEICRGHHYALLITGSRSARESGALDEVVEQINRAQIPYYLVENVHSDPADRFIDEIASIAIKKKVDIVISLGGGSVLDTGKSVAMLITNGGSVVGYQEITSEPKKIKEDPVDFVAIPTTAGSGSEATKNAVVTNTLLGLKRSIRDSKLVPKYAILEPKFTFSLPAHLTAWTGMDALVQCIEPYVGKKAHPMNDYIAEMGIRVIYQNIEIAVKQPENYDARLNMQLGAFFSGIALASSSLGAVHALAHPIGVHYGVHHGLACAVLLPYVMEMNWAYNKEKYANIAVLMGEDGTRDKEYLAQKSVELIFELNRRLNIPENFSEYGFKEEDFSVIIKECKSGSLRNNPRDLDDEDLLQLLRKVV